MVQHLEAGILSPILFSVFINELGVALNNVSIGYHINTQPVNHLLYADDSVILAPTPQTLLKLLHIYGSYANDAELMYNTNKTICMAILPKWLRSLKTPSIMLNGKSVTFIHQHTTISCILVHGSLSEGGRSIQILLHGSISDHLFSHLDPPNGDYCFRSCLPVRRYVTLFLVQTIQQKLLDQFTSFLSMKDPFE